MNRNQVKGTLKVAAGKVQQATGEATGNARQQIKGIRKRVEGRAQKAVGDLEQVAAEVGRK